MDEILNFGRIWELTSCKRREGGDAIIRPLKRHDQIIKYFKRDTFIIRNTSFILYYSNYIHIDFSFNFGSIFKI
jgi:hypothetical protein